MKNESSLTQTAHTPTPWQASPEADCRVTIWHGSCLLADVIGIDARQAKANAAFIVRACNEYDSDKALIRELTEVTKDLLRIVDQHNQDVYAHAGPLQPGESRDWAEQVRARAVLASVKNKTSHD